MRILHVDDDPDIREIAALSLEAFGGHEVCSCESGSVAIDAIQEFKPDLILLDLMMPVMSGEELFEILKEHQTTREVPVVFLSANAVDTTRERLSKNGARGLINKPFNPQTLADDIIKVLNT